MTLDRVAVSLVLVVAAAVMFRMGSVAMGIVGLVALALCLLPDR